MNKKSSIVIAIIVILLLCFIGGYFLTHKEKKTDVKKDRKSIEEKAETKKNTSEKTAILYFSATSTTKKVAQMIHNKIESDLIEILPSEPYTSEDLDYSKEDCRANKEQQSDKARPGIKNEIDISSYDVIYLGYPIWWQDVPKIILTFIDTHDLTGKKVILFCTSGGSDITTSMDTLKKYNSKIHFITGKRLNPSSQEVNSWISSLNY